MSGSWRICIVLTIAAVVQAAATTSAQRVEPPARQTLRRQTFISVREPTTFKVRLPRDVTIDIRKGTLFGRGSGIELLGGGRMIGIAIVQDGSAWVGPRLAAFRFRECGEPGCFGSASPMKFTVPFGVPEVSLPAGKYAIHVVTDGAPVEIRLAIPQLHGSTVLSDGSPARVDLATPESSIASRSGPSIFEASRTYRVFGRHALALSASWARGSTYEGSRHTFCLSNTTGDPPQPARGFAACANPAFNGGFVGGSGDELAASDASATRLVQFSAYGLRAERTVPSHPADPRRWTYGFSVSSRGALDSIGAQALVLTL
jgi:hypothetical protein